VRGTMSIRICKLILSVMVLAMSFVVINCCKLGE